MTDLPLAGLGQANKTALEFDKERLATVRELIPGVTMTGSGLDNSEPGGFPAISYHGYADRDHFELDDFFDGGFVGVNNQLFGHGLYAGKRDLAETYQRHFMRQGRRTGIARIMANRAILLDNDDYSANQKVSYGLIDRIDEYCDAKIKSQAAGRGRDEDELRMFKHFVRSGSAGHRPPVGDLTLGSNAFGWKYPGYRIDTKHRLGFLTSIGVDGVSASIYPGIDPSRLHKMAVFWRRERVGDKSTWEKRLDRLDDMSSTFHHVGNMAVSAQLQPQGRPLFINGANSLRRSPDLNYSRGVEMSRKLESSHSILDTTKARALVELTSNRKLDALEMVRQFAALDPLLDKLMSSKTGVWEGYLLHEHTQAVMNQFARNWLGNFEPMTAPLQRAGAFMNLVLLMHDLGKPIAHAIDGNTQRQGYFTGIAVRNVLRNAPLKPGVKDLIVDIVSQDHIGNYLKNGSAVLESSAQGVAELLEKHEDIIDPADLWQLLFIEHECDASAYTDIAAYRTAGGELRYCLPSLNGIFKLDPYVRRVRHKREQVERMQRLVLRVNELFELSA